MLNASHRAAEVSAVLAAVQLTNTAPVEQFPLDWTTRVALVATSGGRLPLGTATQSCRVALRRVPLSDATPTPAELETTGRNFFAPVSTNVPVLVTLTTTF